MPRVVEFRSEPLPKSNIGKILRREPRDRPAATSLAAPATGADLNT
jgi:long-chain acyl-CoA synthetase